MGIAGNSAGGPPESHSTSHEAPGDGRTREMVVTAVGGTEPGLQACLGNRFARGKPLIHAMPPGNVWLVDFPAQVDDFFAAQRKKIHKTEVHIFDDATMGLNFLYQPDQAHLGVTQVVFIGVSMHANTGFGSHAASSLCFEQSYSHLAPSLQQLGDEGS